MRAMYGLALSAIMTAAAVPEALAQNVSINAVITGQIVPGVYGQFVVGNGPPPPLVYSQPVIVQPPAVAVVTPMQPIYLHVPPGHAKHWSKHCHEYDACNRPVYFVKSAEYEPGYAADHGHHHGHDEDGDHDNRHHD